jgi:hypothetical protein
MYKVQKLVMLLPKMVKVVCRNGDVHYGYFQSFDDYKKLKEEGKFRFVPNSSLIFLKQKYNGEELNGIDSIVISADNVADIDFVGNDQNYCD